MNFNIRLLQVGPQIEKPSGDCRQTFGRAALSPLATYTSDERMIFLRRRLRKALARGLGRSLSNPLEAEIHDRCDVPNPLDVFRAAAACALSGAICCSLRSRISELSASTQTQTPNCARRSLESACSSHTMANRSWCLGRFRLEQDALPVGGYLAYFGIIWGTHTHIYIYTYISSHFLQPISPTACQVILQTSKSPNIFNEHAIIFLPLYPISQTPFSQGQPAIHLPSPPPPTPQHPNLHHRIFQRACQQPFANPLRTPPPLQHCWTSFCIKARH